MENRRRERVRSSLSVRVFGLDANGSPFSKPARTVDLTANGARLAGLDVTLNPGDIIGVQNGSSKARFQVVWVGNSSRNRGQIGLKCLEQESKIWGNIAVDTQGDFARSAAFIERRKQHRYDCDLGLEMRVSSDAAPVHVRCTDISRTGCYLETWSPLPIGTSFLITLRLPNGRIQATAEVRTNDANFGMGVHLFDVDAPEILERYITNLQAGIKQKLTDFEAAAVRNVKTNLNAEQQGAETPAISIEDDGAPKFQVLLADDSRFLRSAYSMYLKRAGFDVVTADDGEQALDLARSRQPDIIILDLLMPKVGGVAALGILKETPTTKSIPVIILSGLPSSNSAKLKSTGAFAYASKTEVGPEELPDLIRLALAQRGTLLPARQAIDMIRADA